MGFLNGILGKKSPTRAEQVKALRHQRMTDRDQFIVDKAEAERNYLNLQREKPNSDEAHAAEFLKSMYEEAAGRMFP